MYVHVMHKFKCLNYSIIIVWYIGTVTPHRQPFHFVLNQKLDDLTKSLSEQNKMLQKNGKEATELRQEIAELKTQVAEMKENIKSKVNTKNELKKTVPKDISVSLFGNTYDIFLKLLLSGKSVCACVYIPALRL